MNLMSLDIMVIMACDKIPLGAFVYVATHITCVIALAKLMSYLCIDRVFRVNKPKARQSEEYFHYYQHILSQNGLVYIISILFYPHYQVISFFICLYSRK